MAKFFVGQRVRIVWVHQSINSHLIGLEGRVCEFLPGSFGLADLYGLDIRPIRTSIEDGGVFVTKGLTSDQLAPMLPEGQQPCGESYEQLMGRLRAGVVA